MPSQRDYRTEAMNLFPSVCARCGREFSGKRLKELTVHHKDHNHNNNPRDGSNWELLCIYCHENEHSRKGVASAYDHTPLDYRSDPVTAQPFADLDKLLKRRR
jgi:hypothetical protein